MYYYLTDQELRTLETELANIKNAIRELEFLDGEARFRNLSSEERQEYINRKRPCIVCGRDIVMHSSRDSYEVGCSECGFIYAED